MLRDGRAPALATDDGSLDSTRFLARVDRLRRLSTVSVSFHATAPCVAGHATQTTSRILLPSIIAPMKLHAVTSAGRRSPAARCRCAAGLRATTCGERDVSSAQLAKLTPVSTQHGGGLTTLLARDPRRSVDIDACGTDGAASLAVLSAPLAAAQPAPPPRPTSSFSHASD